MGKVIAICNSGPLMALAKLGVLSKALSIYPGLTISETVYHEAVVSGLDIGARDAAQIANLCQRKHILIIPSNIDDLDARRVAEENIQKMATDTILKGTLGILVELYQKESITSSQLKKYLDEINRRKDIWISPRLCQKLIESIDAGFL